MQNIHTNLIALMLIMVCVSCYGQVSVKEISVQIEKNLFFDAQTSEWKHHIGLNDKYEVDTFDISLVVSDNKVAYYVTLSDEKRLLQESSTNGNLFHGVTNKYEPGTMELKCRTNYKNGLKVGKEEIFYQNILTFIYCNGKIKSMQERNLEGAILEEGEYKDTCRYGLWKYYTDEKKPNLKLEEFYDGCELKWRKQYMKYLEDWEK